MTQKEQIRLCHDLFVKAADRMAETGMNPAAIAEGGLAGMLHLSEHMIGGPALADWLRDAANHIEARAARDGNTLQ